MGRLLGPANYGILVALLSLLALLTIPAGVITTVVIRFTAQFKIKNQMEQIRSLFYFLTKYLFFISITASVILIAASGPINHFLKIPSRTPTVLLAILLILMFLLPITRGILQGLQKFTSLSLNICIDSFVKLLIGVSFAYLGFGVNGAMIALIVGTSAAYFFTFLSLKKIALKFNQTPVPIARGEIASYFKDVFWAFLFLTLLINVDIILVKHFLSAQEAGYYGALSTMGKIVMFISTPITGVMFPMVTGLYEKGEKHWRLLFSALFLITVLGLCVVAVYFIVPTFSVKILFGSKYLSVASALPLFGLAMLLYSLCYAMSNYFLSIKKTGFIIPLALFTILETILIWFYHGSFITIIKILIFIFALTLAVLTTIYALHKKSQLANYISRYQ